METDKPEAAPLGELRLDEHGVIDEYVIRGVDFHLERLDRDYWWIGLTLPGGRTVHVRFATKGKTVPVVEEDP